MKVNKELRQKVFDEISMFSVHVPYEDVVKWIDDNCKNKSWSNTVKKPICRATYGLKHLLEADFNSYCCNNACKLALIELGFDVYPYELLDEDGHIIRSLLGNENYINDKYLCDEKCHFIFKRNKSWGK